MKIPAMILVSAMALTACNPWGERVEVPPASVGMVLSANGYQGDVILPSRFRLSPCFV